MGAEMFHSKRGSRGAGGARLMASVLLSVGAAAVSYDATAQEAAAEADASEEIVVTARKREERLFEVPASLDVFSGADLDQAGVLSLDALQYNTPGLKIAQGGGAAQISLRGIGNNLAGFGAGPSVAVHVDGVYIPQPRFAMAELFDAERVEVLKGPEGTLYGRNATGGVINVISQDPDSTFAADGYVGAGSFGLFTTSLAASAPFNEHGGVRLSGFYANDDGYTDNLNASGGRIDHRDYLGLRARGRYDLSNDAYLAATVQYVQDNGTIGLGGSNNPSSLVYASFPPDQRADVRNINIDTPPQSEQRGLLFAGEFGFDIGSVSVRSITGYVDYNTESTLDVDGSSGFIGIVQSETSSDYLSQEFQFSGERAGFSWTAGMYFGRERARIDGGETDANWPDPTPFVFTDIHARTVTESYGVFGEGTFALTDRLSLLLGARYTEESVEGSQVGSILEIFPIDDAGETSDNAFTPKMVLQYQPSEDLQIYFSATRGFKSGGLNYGTEITPFDAENVWAYELGTRVRTGDGAAEFGLAAFYYDYTNLQLRSAIFTPAGVTVTVNNAGTANVTGVEGSARVRLARGLNFNLGAAYLDTELNNFFSPVTLADLSGMPLPFAPEWSVTAALEYEADFENQSAFNARLEYAYQSEVLFSQFTDLDRERQEGYGQWNASVRYDLPGGRTYVSLIGRNLADETFLTQRFYYDGFADIEFYGRPRTVEARLGFRL